MPSEGSSKASKAKKDAGASFKRAASSGKLPVDGAALSKSKRSARPSARGSDKKKEAKTPPDTKGTSGKSPFHAKEAGSAEGAPSEGASATPSSADSSYVIKAAAKAPPTTSSPTASLPRVIDAAEREELEQLRSLGVGTGTTPRSAAELEVKEEAPTRAPLLETPAADSASKPAAERGATPATELGAEPATAPAAEPAATAEAPSPAAAAVAPVPPLDVEDLQLELTEEPDSVDAVLLTVVPEEPPAVATETAQAEVVEEEAAKVEEKVEEKVKAEAITEGEAATEAALEVQEAKAVEAEEAKVEEAVVEVAPPRRIELVLSAASDGGGAAAAGEGAEPTKPAAPFLVYALHDAATLHGADGILSSGIPTPSPTPTEGGETDGGELVLHPSYPLDGPHGPGCSVYIWIDAHKALADGIRFHEDPSLGAVVSQGRVAGWTAESGRASSGSIPPSYFSTVVELRDGLGEAHSSKAARLRLVECCFPGCSPVPHTLPHTVNRCCPKEYLAHPPPLTN